MGGGTEKAMSETVQEQEEEQQQLEQELEQKREDRKMSALQVAVVSSIFAECGNTMEITCLSLCNTFRDGAALPRLSVCSRSPSTLLFKIYPESPRALASAPACPRVLPYRRVSALGLEWGCGGEILGAPKWPAGVKHIYLACFDTPLENISWPATVTCLSFDEDLTAGRPWCMGSSTFNQPVVAAWPAELRELYLGKAFNQPIVDVEVFSTCLLILIMRKV